MLNLQMRFPNLKLGLFIKVGDAVELPIEENP